MHHTLHNVAALLVSSALLGQEVRLLGELTQQGGELRFVTPHVVLQPGATSLANELGQFIDVSGILVSGTAAPTVAVTAAARTDHTFELNGSSRIGDELRLRVESPTASVYYLIASLAPGFLPLQGIPGLSGTVFVALPTTLVHAGPIDQSWEEPLPIPLNPALIGLELWFQAVVFDGAFLYLNGQQTTITGL